jgi:hypothetical protein
MTAGLRHIQAVKLTADLPTSAQEGDLCWDYETMQMNVWRDGGWTLFAQTVSEDILDVMTYDYNKASGFTNLPETYSTLNDYTSPSRPAGVYEVGMSFTYDFDQANRSVYFRWSTDGGTNWNEFVAEPKDVQDKSAVYYQYPFSHPGGTMQIETQIRKEDVNGILNAPFADVWFRRVA